ncbi:hypothetical protein ABT093_30380 [Kitasatospora sp. NPDC002551]|uniref:hypothetical protein n=1 Tax=Kitasatospora sp. NPDC002551 TaxID=3154539 RepID=UPI00332B2650
MPDDRGSDTGLRIWSPPPMSRRPLVDPNPWLVPSAHLLVLEAQRYLPPPSGDLPRRPGTLHPYTSERFDKGLWEMARHYRGRYVRPEDLERNCAKLLARARTAAEAVLEAPSWRRINGEHSETVTRSLPDQIWRMALTLGTVRHDDVIDVGAAYWPFLSTLERAAAKAFDYAFDDAETIEVAVINSLTVRSALPPALLKTPPAEDWPVTARRVTCECGRDEQWFVVFADDRAAVGCKCGRMWWENGLPRDALRQIPGYAENNLRTGFHVDSLAAEFGFGPFQHAW